MKILTSTVPGHEGECSPIWLNGNKVCNRLDNGVTGFFRLVKSKFFLKYRTGNEFHGILAEGVVQDTRIHVDVECVESLDGLQRSEEK